jgi:hypothetical protein
MRTLKKKNPFRPKRQKRNKVSIITLRSFLGGSYKRSLAMPAVFRYECLYIITNTLCFVKSLRRSACKRFVNGQQLRIMPKHTASGDTLSLTISAELSSALLTSYLLLLTSKSAKKMAELRSSAETKQKNYV